MGRGGAPELGAPGVLALPDGAVATFPDGATAPLRRLQGLEVSERPSGAGSVRFEVPDDGLLVLFGYAVTYSARLQSITAYPDRMTFAVATTGPTVTLRVAAGATLNGVDGGSVAITTAYAPVTVVRLAADEWIVLGAEAAVS